MAANENTTTLEKFDYTHDVAGNILTGRQQADSAAVLWSYGYDTVDQLTSAVKTSTDPTPAILKRYNYAYDPVSNRTVEQIDDVVIGASYDNINRLLSQQPSGAVRLEGAVSEPASVTVGGKPFEVSNANRFIGSIPVGSGTTPFTVTATDVSGNTASQTFEVDSAGTGKAFTFDGNGNMTSDGTRVIEWDARNRITAITIGLHRTEFSYDGRGRRFRSVEKENGVVQEDLNLIWCNDAVCETRRADNGDRVRALFSHGAVAGGTPEFIVADHLGSVWQVTTSQGALLSRYAFDPSGRRSSVRPSDVSDIGYAGQEWHAESGLWLAMYRSYDPNLGVWLSQDPIGFDGGMNWYGYAENNPIRFDDPLGLKVTCNSSVRKVNVKKITTKGCEGAWGCTSFDNISSQTYRCEYDKCSKTWKFDGLVEVALLVEFAVPENTPITHRPGGTVGGHEALHVSDDQRGCRALNSKIKTEGFSSRKACDAALATFPNDVLRAMAAVGDRTHATRDKKP